jgi:uncharacterized membrane protein YqaE (UPF0057 family)
MRYLLAILLPPVAVFLIGKPFQGFLNILLTMAGYLPGIIHALFLVNEYKQDKRTDKMIKAIVKSKE